MVAARFTVGLGHESFLYGARLFWHSWDLLYSIVKGLVFGFVIPLISVHMGFEHARRRRGRRPRHDGVRRVHDHHRARAGRDLPAALPELSP